MDAKQKNKKRYNLHYRIRKQGYKLGTHARTIYVPYNDLNISKQVAILKNEFDYGVQLELV